MGSWTTHKLLGSKRAESAREGEIVPLSDDEFEQVWARERKCFLGFILMSTGNIGSTGKSQMFFPTFAARFHGLSRQGTSCLAAHGFLLPIASYDRQEKLFLEELADKRRFVRHMS